MELSFKDKEIRKICEDISYAANKYGSACAHNLKTRLADLRAGTNLNEIPNKGLYDLSNPELFKVNLGDNNILTFRNGHVNAKAGNLESVPLNHIRRVYILEITNIH